MDLLGVATPAATGFPVGLFGADALERRIRAALLEKEPFLKDEAPEAVDVRRLLELCARWAKELIAAPQPFVRDTTAYLHHELDAGKRVLFEGAQGALLDVDFGTYPYVTSSNAGIGGLCAGTGVPPAKLGRVIGVAKAYATRVGGGPFPTELEDATGERLRQVGKEFGATTGRPRRCGWFDIPAARYAIQFCGVDSICLTKLDVLSGLDEVRVCTGYRLSVAPFAILNESSLPPSQQFSLVQYGGVAAQPAYETLEGWKEPLDDIHREEDLPPAARAYVRFLEERLGVEIGWLSVGRRRDQLIARGGGSPWPTR
jgi:adenylosuccinate synthase